MAGCDDDRRIRRRRRRRKRWRRRRKRRNDATSSSERPIREFVQTGVAFGPGEGEEDRYLAVVVA